MAFLETLKKETQPKVSVRDVVREVPGVIKRFLTRKVPITDVKEMALGFGPGGFAKAGQKVASTVAQEVTNLSPVQKLITAIKQAGKPRAELEQAYTAERAQRAQTGTKALETGGQKGYFEALGTLKGELAPKPKFQPLNITKSQAPNTTLLPDSILQKDVDDLFTQVQATGKLDFYEKISASQGLQKLFDGQLPQPNQLTKLEEVFGPDLIRAVQTQRSFGEKFRQGVTDFLNIPRSLVTSIDMSAPLRQGILLTTTKPKIAIPNMGKMFVDFFSKKEFDQWLLDLPNNPRYSQMKDSKLYIADPNKVSGGLSAREESFMSNIAEKIPGVGALIQASSRAYIGFLNKMRVDVFTQLAQKFEKEGIADPQNLQSLANYVNAATGRGDLGRFSRISNELNTIFFSPRLMMSRVNFLNPVWYAKQTPAVRKEAIKTFAEFIGVGSTILAISKAAGADVELDPRSTDFGKIKVGNTRWDIWGGFQQWVRAFSQIGSGKKKNPAGKVVSLDSKKYPFTSRGDVAIQFLRGKLAPSFSSLVDLMEGQNIVGEKTNLTKEIFENTIPLYLQDIDKAFDEFGPEAFFTVLAPAFFGVGTQNYESKKTYLKSFK